MKAEKAAKKFARAIERSAGRETRPVRRARWAMRGHARPVWTPLKTFSARRLSREQYEEEQKEQRKFDRETRRAKVASYAKDIFAMLGRTFTRRHQGR